MSNWISTKDRLPTDEDSNNEEFVMVCDEEDERPCFVNWYDAREWDYWTHAPDMPEKPEEERNTWAVKTRTDTAAKSIIGGASAANCNLDPEFIPVGTEHGDKLTVIVVRGEPEWPRRDEDSGDHIVQICNADYNEGVRDTLNMLGLEESE